MYLCLCKIDGSARRQVVHFIECLYRPPVTRVGVGGTADRARADYYYCCRMPVPVFICDFDEGAAGREGPLDTDKLSLTNFTTLDEVYSHFLFMAQFCYLKIYQGCVFKFNL